MKRFENLEVKKDEIETRLVCPCCHMGFIVMDNEMEDKFVFPSRRNEFIVPINMPTCYRCDSKFEISIDKTLKIKIKKI